MGFMDKLKNVGKGALKGVLSMAATSYGTVVSGKHNLCKVCLNSAHDTLIFIKIADIEEQYVIRDSIKTFIVTSDDVAADRYMIELEYNDGDTSMISLKIEDNKGSGLDSAAQRVAAHYSDAAKFLIALTNNVSDISDNTKTWVNKIMRFANQPEFK